MHSHFLTSPQLTCLTYLHNTVIILTRAHMVSSIIGRPRQNGTPVSAVKPQPWNPAQLLDPKGFTSNPVMTNENKRLLSSPHSTRPAQSYIFDTPGSSNSGMSNVNLNSQYQHHAYTNNHANPNNANGNATMHGYGHQNGQVIGMGHMLDRRFNIAERDMIPQKRRKVVEERHPDEVKSQFSGGGKGGVLGQYVHDQREDGRKHAQGNTVKSVDLTGGEWCILLYGEYLVAFSLSGSW